MNPFYCRCAEYFVINIAIYVKKEKEANASFKTYQKYHQYALKNINSIFQKKVASPVGLEPTAL